MSYAYRDDAATDTGDYEQWLDELIPLLSSGDSVLDLGCGCGVPVAKRLAERFAVTGIDISPVQIERAMRLVPAARFICQDIGAVSFEPSSFGAIVSFFALIHVPVEEQPEIIRRLGQWLRPGGYLMATVGARAWTGIEEGWHGAPMYWSHADRETYIRWLEASGFRIVSDRFIPEGNAGHTLLLAQH